MRTLLAIAAGLAAAPLMAATITVNTLDTTSTTACTLADAVRAANDDVARGQCLAGDGEDTIEFRASLFNSGEGIINLSQPLGITEGLTLNGPGRDKLRVRGSNTGTFNITAANGSVYVSLNGLTISDGEATRGGAASITGSNPSNDGPTLILTDCLIEDNRASESGAGLYVNNANVDIERCAIHANLLDGNNSRGAGIYVEDGSLVLRASSVTDNGELAASVASGSTVDGGGIAVIGNSKGSFAKLINATLSGNRALRHGGGLYIEDESSNGSASNALELFNVTLSSNSANDDNVNDGTGGGIYSIANSGNNEVMVGNSLIVGNESGSVSESNCAGSFTSAGYNIVGDSGCTGLTQSARNDSVLTATNAGVEPLQLAASGLYYHPLANTSAAIDNGTNRIDNDNGVPIYLCRMDQLGVARPVDGDGDVSGVVRCDIGAYEHPAGNSASIDLALADQDVTYFNASNPGQSQIYTSGLVNYSATVRNRGQSGASGARLTLSVASGMEVIGAENNLIGLSCSQTSPLICELGSISAGQSVPVDILLKAPASSGDARVSASVAAIENDSQSSNNTHNTDIPVASSAAGVLSLASLTYNANENTNNLVIMVRRTGGSSGTVSVDYATSNGTAESGKDYTAVSNTLTWVDGDTGNKEINISITEDDLVEGNETFKVTLSNATGSAAIGTASSTITIIDNEQSSSAGYIDFSQSSYQVNEDGSSVTINLTRTRGSNGQVSIRYATDNGTATAGEDYTARSGVLSWADGVTETKSFTIPISNDTTKEDDETVIVRLSDGSGGVEWNTNLATVTIRDDDGAGTLSFARATDSVNENNNQLQVMVTRSNGIAGEVTVKYRSENGTATAGEDYTALSGTLTWAAGDATAKTLTIDLTDDTVFEGNENFKLILSEPGGGAALGSAEITVTIVENEVRISASPGPVQDSGKKGGGVGAMGPWWLLGLLPLLLGRRRRG